ncbi:hypothetical protein B2J93_153 [Marssonina coronariae]|uniref:C3H1-type domain-containing protein n=1 Tax=Diplocarpon coronariae TaxID=2795749 RepID=A0A218Z694_9HELO|nr:hypothetical protein B2J93_153 [Marssonina coronariae]
MSTSEADEATLAPVISVEPLPPAEDDIAAMDTEMIASLTSRGDRGNQPHNSSPSAQEMASFGRDGHWNGPINQGQPPSSWRSEGGNPGPAPYSPNAPMIGGPFSPRTGFLFQGDAVPVSTIVPGWVHPSKDQLDTAYAYAIPRGDGTYTRLVRADDLDLSDIPPAQGPEGLIIVPSPRQVEPGRRLGGEPMVPNEVVERLANLYHNPLHGRRRRFDDTQGHIDSIVRSAQHTPGHRPEKIYCDKWIHEGVCAFTQMGCKYRHEMPSDKATQMMLGLNHGTPSWYRRAFGSTLGPETPPAALVSTPPRPSQRLAGNVNRGEYRASGPWRAGPSRSQSGGSASLNGALQGGAREFVPNLTPPRFADMSLLEGNNSQNYGAIGHQRIQGPPPQLMSLTSNTFSDPKNENSNEDEEDGGEGAITFSGRR